MTQLFASEEMLVQHCEASVSQLGYKVYCEITYSPITRTAMLNIGATMDVIRDKEGNPVEFISMVDAVNYMAKLGWEMAEAYGIPKGNDKVTYVYLVKEVSSDSDAMKGLNLKSIGFKLH